MKKNKRELFKERLGQLKDKPGVYHMLDKEGHLLYIGKSKKIRTRVSSYFIENKDRSRKIQRMISQIRDFQVYYTDTELDALLLECQWIQQKNPPYNTSLTRSHKYRYFEIYDKPRYTLRLSHSPHKEALLCIGPVSNRRLMQYTYQFIETYYPEMTKKGRLSELMGINRGDMIQIENFEEDVLLPGENIRMHIEKRMEKNIEDWAYEQAAKRLDELKGLRYLQFMYKLNREIALETYIGVLPIEETRFYKYYLVEKGHIKKMLRGTKNEEALIINKLKTMIVNEDEKEKVLIEKDAIDKILITKAFKNKSMHVIKV